jgi:hypothetical protein
VRQDKNPLERPNKLWFILIATDTSIPTSNRQIGKQ